MRKATDSLDTSFTEALAKRVASYRGLKFLTDEIILCLAEYRERHTKTSAGSNPSGVLLL